MAVKRAFVQKGPWRPRVWAGQKSRLDEAVAQFIASQQRKSVEEVKRRNAQVAEQILLRYPQLRWANSGFATPSEASAPRSSERSHKARKEEPSSGCPVADRPARRSRA